MFSILAYDALGPKEYETRAKACDPLSGGVVETLRCLTTFSDAVAEIFTYVSGFQLVRY
jgi:hypothetical protein